MKSFTVSPFFRLVALALVASVTPLGAVIPSDLSNPEYALDPAHLDQSWVELLAGLQTESSLEARFRERRENDFRRAHRYFQGTLRMSAQSGVSLHYEGGLDVTLVATPGAVWRRPSGGEWTAYAIDSESGMASWSESLWRLDLQALDESFTLHGRQTAEGSWELLLSPRSDRRLPRLYLQGDREALERLEVVHNPRRRTVYFMQAVDRSPDTSDWPRFFPHIP